jgi:hypothetical protein
MKRWTFILLAGVSLAGLANASAEMNMDNTLSEGAQRNTIAFDGLAFLTGSIGSDSFFPPGKVADFWGFQYLRDNDPSNMGHNTDFLTLAANNMLYVLPNGNTLVCAGVIGHLFEVTPAGETVWQYMNPMVRGGILAQGELPGKDMRGHLWNAVFKVHRYAPDYPGLAGRDLTPNGVIELPASQKGKTGLDQLNEQSRDNHDRPGRDDKPDRPRRN